MPEDEANETRQAVATDASELAEPATPVDTQEWADQAVDMIEAAVGTVRDKAVEPAQRATSKVVFGVLVAFFAVPAMLLLLIGGFRLVNNYLPGEVWATWLLFGGIFVVAGLFTWARRHPKRA